MPEDVVFYSDRRGVRVTGNGITVDNAAYLFANPTYVAVRVEQPSRFGPFLIIAVGLLSLAERTAQRSFGIAIFAAIVTGIGVFLLTECKPVYSIDLSIVAGERAPVVRSSKERITAIAKAINEAIALRLTAQDAAPLPVLRNSDASELSVHS